jgi:cytochrome c553
MMKTTAFSLFWVLACAAAPALATTDPEAGKAKVESVCASCHGVRGISAAPAFPNLAGQKEEYLRSALTAYRDGSRKAPIMNHMAAGLSDRDIANLAAYLSGLKP